MKLEKKYQEQTIICRICAQEMKTGILKEHSNLCRKQGEIEKSQKTLDKRLAEMIHQSQIKSKNVHTNIVLTSKSYYKLKEKVESPIIQGRPGRGFTFHHPTYSRPTPTLSSSQLSFNGSPMNPRPRGFSGGFQKTTAIKVERNFSAAVEEHISPKVTIDTVTENASELDFMEKKFFEEEEFVLEVEEPKKDEDRMAQSALLPRNSIFPDYKKEKTSKLKPMTPLLRPTQSPMIKPKGKAKKRRSRKTKTQVNHDTNCNFYSDPDHAGNRSSNSSDSRESVESVVSTAVMRHSNYFDTPLRRNVSFCPEKSPPEVHFSLQSSLIISPPKKSRFARQSESPPIEKNEEKEDKKLGEDLPECISDGVVEEDHINIPDSDAFSFSPQSDQNSQINSLQSSAIFSTLNQSMFKEGKDCKDDKTRHAMYQLKVKLMSKKIAKQIYDFISTKGKVLLNEGAYQRSKFSYKIYLI